MKSCLTLANFLLKNSPSSSLMQKLTKKMMLLLATCLFLNACGTKGPLYIPEQQYPQPTKAAK
jgi:predicted small lipoprotein YifL